MTESYIAVSGQRFLWGDLGIVQIVKPSGWEGDANRPKVPTNILKLRVASPDPHPHYYRGVGNQGDYHGVNRGLGLALGSGMSGIVNLAMRDLVNDRAHHDNTVDIIGFSRGGIQATEFANQVSERFPNETIRFVGLFDPVGSVGYPGGFGSFRHDLPDNVQVGVEAMARDENRAWFPATDVQGAAQTWFRGCHSDIGGGFDPFGPNDNGHQISDFVLMWMAAQAQNAGVPLDLNRSVLLTGIPLTPNANGPVHHVGNITSIFTTNSRYVISDFGNYTYIEYSAF